jgi:hypothetical protein
MNLNNITDSRMLSTRNILINLLPDKPRNASTAVKRLHSDYGNDRNQMNFLGNEANTNRKSHWSHSTLSYSDQVHLVQMSANQVAAWG